MSEAHGGLTPPTMLSRVLGVQRGEFVAVAWSFVYFFCLLSGYYMLRPVRETMATISGVDTIPYLFTGTFVAMLIATPIFGWVASRFPRRTFLPWVYYFFITNIALFYIAFRSVAEDSPEQLWLARGFFVWISVFNLFVVSVFWSFMADIFSRQQSRRLFGLISAGGSTGAIVGPWFTREVVVDIGFERLFPLSAILLTIAVVCVFQLRGWVATRGSTEQRQAATTKRAIGGSPFAGIRIVLTQPLFAGIAFALLITNFLGGAIYYFMADFVAAAYPEVDERTRVFATIDTVTSALSFLGQFLLVRLSVQHLGIGKTLMVVPALSVIGFTALAINPTFIVLASLQVMRRAVGFGLTKPTMDMLYAAFTPEERYKAKNFIDTTVYRTADLVTAWSVRAIGGAVGIVGVAAVCAPLAAAGTALAYWIGRQYQRRDKTHVTEAT